MQVYVLTFNSRASLTHAFDAVLDAPDVESCMIENEHLRIRFVSPSGAGEKVIERIYLDGGLRWCSRHPVAETEIGGAA